MFYTNGNLCKVCDCKIPEERYKNGYHTCSSICERILVKQEREIEHREIENEFGSVENYLSQKRMDEAV